MKLNAIFAIDSGGPVRLIANDNVQGVGATGHDYVVRHVGSSGVVQNDVIAGNTPAIH